MVEIVVVMVIMSIVLIIFTTGITQAFSAENKVDTASQAENQLVIAFQRLDKEVRYASGDQHSRHPERRPGRRVPEPEPDRREHIDLHRSPAAHEHRPAAAAHLDRRGVADRARPAGSSSPRRSSRRRRATPASASTPTVSVTAPFAVIEPGSVFQYQRIEIAVTVTFGTNKNKTSKQSDITFTAMNTTSSSTASTVGSTCTGGRGVSW